MKKLTIDDFNAKEIMELSDMVEFKQTAFDDMFLGINEIFNNVFGILWQDSEIYSAFFDYVINAFILIDSDLQDGYKMLVMK